MDSNDRKNGDPVSGASFSVLVPCSNSFSPQIYPASSITVIILSWQVKKLKNKFKSCAPSATVNNRAVCVIFMQMISSRHILLHAMVTFMFSQLFRDLKVISLFISFKHAVGMKRSQRTLWQSCSMDDSQPWECLKVKLPVCIYYMSGCVLLPFVSDCVCRCSVFITGSTLLVAAALFMSLQSVLGIWRASVPVT